MNQAVQDTQNNQPQYHQDSEKEFLINLRDNLDKYYQHLHDLIDKMGQTKSTPVVMVMVVLEMVVVKRIAMMVELKHDGSVCITGT